MEQNKSTKRLPGFYIALCCCVVAIGVAGFIAQNMESRSTNAVTQVTETDTPLPVVTYAAANEAADIPSVQPAQTPAPYSDPPQTAAPAAETAAEAAAIPEYAVDNPDTEPASVIVQAEEGSQFSDPVPGMTVIYGFSGGTLMYNDVLDDWRTHDGIDIEADIGCSVSAAADGTVSYAGEGTYGGTVVIEHDNGLSTTYSQLGDINVNEGDSIIQGAVIGTIGESKGETTKGAHLHYEIHQNGEPVDPLEY